MTLEEALPLIVPLVILQLVLIAVALFDLTRPERRVRGGSKVLWAVIILLFQLFGPLVYFFFGREDS
jgi:hypothetical protein